MAEEQNENKGEKKGLSPLIRIGFFLSVALLVPAIIAWVLFDVVLKPKLAREPEVVTPVDDLPPFPPTMMTVDFDQMEVSVQTDDPDLAAPLLLLQVSLSCADEVTAGTVEARKQYFAAMILGLHQGRTRSELNDPLVQNSILEQIRIQSNTLLKRLSPAADLQVLKAMYLKFAIMDL